MITYKEIEDLGYVKFVSYKNSKSIRIHLKPFSGISVTYPYGYPLKKVQTFLFENIEGIKESLNRVREIERIEVSRVKKLKIFDIEKADLQLKKRINYLSELYRLPFERITIREQKTRWGSCSSKNNINLNRFIVTIPDKLQDYVILHELIHTRVKNHSTLFWQELEKVYPNCKEAAREMRQYSLPKI